MSHNHLILGCPGSGKTHTLINIAIDALSGRSHSVIDLPSVTSAKDIAFLSFTRKAALEGAERIKRETGDEGPNFRTIHSLCYNLLNLKRVNVVTGQQLAKVAQEYGLEIGADFGEGMRELSYDEFLYQTVQSIEYSKVSIEQALQRANKPLYEGKLLKVKEMQASFLERDLYTFSDMLHQVLIREDIDIPNFDLLIVDEAQDLTILQWLVVEKLREQARTFIVAGDDNQAIHEWAGADVNYFLTIEQRYENMTKEVITKSRRCPSAIQRAGVYVNRRMKKKIDRGQEWTYSREGGRIKYIQTLENFDPFQDGKEIFMLGRTRRDLNKFRAFGYLKGFLWRDGDNLSIDNREIKAVLNYLRLQRGDTLSGEAVKEVFRHTKLKPEIDVAEYYDRDTVGITLPPWEEVFQIKHDRARYLRKILRRYLLEDITDGSSYNITISTMHSVKGDEADIVIINEHLTSKILKKWLERADDELRVLYTAITRSKDQLIFLSGQGKSQYNAQSFLSHS